MQLPPGSTPPLISRGGCGGLDVQGSGLRALSFLHAVFLLPPTGVQGGVSVPRRYAIAGRGRPPVMAPLGGYGGYYILLPYLLKEKRCIRYENEYTFFLLAYGLLALVCYVVGHACLYALHRVLRQIR